MTVVTDGGGPGTFRGMRARGSDPQQLQSGMRPRSLRDSARRKDKKFTRADAEKMSAKQLASAGERTLRLTPQTETHVLDLRNYCYFPWWSSKLNRSIRSPTAGRFKGT